MVAYRSFVLSACITLAPFSSLAAAEVTTDPPVPPAATAMTKLGEIKLGNIPIIVNRRGNVIAGKNLQLEFIIPGETPRPFMLTTWASNSSKDEESLAKVHAAATASGRIAATIQLPSIMNEGSVLWISIEPADGKTVSGTLPLLQLQ